MGRWPVRRAEDLGGALAELRTERGSTQAQLAESVGVSTAYIAKMEQGRTTPLMDLIVDTLIRSGASIEVTWPDQRAESGSP